MSESLQHKLPARETKPMSELEDAIVQARNEVKDAIGYRHPTGHFQDHGPLKIVEKCKCRACAALTRLERLVRLDERAKAPCEQYRWQGDDFMICDLGDDEAEEHYAKRYRCPSCSAEAEIAEAVKEVGNAERNAEPA